VTEGACYLVPKVDDHVWVVISDPSQNPELIVVVRFLSETEGTENDCILDVGDHPFIKHRTCINYTGAAHVSIQTLQGLANANTLKWMTPVSPEVLARIRGAAETSDIPLKYYQVLRDQGLVP
jgi:hypothetical protein